MKEPFCPPGFVCNPKDGYCYRTLDGSIKDRLKEKTPEKIKDAKVQDKITEKIKDVSTQDKVTERVKDVHDERECQRSFDCNDGIYCTTDLCANGKCHNIPREGRCKEGQRCLPEKGGCWQPQEGCEGKIPSNNQCEKAQELLLQNCSGEITNASTLCAADTYEPKGPNCGKGNSSSEIVYKFFMPGPQKIDISISSDFKALLYLRRGRCNGEEVACAFDRGGIKAKISKTLAPDVYYLFVDGYGKDQKGDFTLTYELSPPSNNRTEQAEDITQTGRFYGSTICAENNYDPHSSPDVVYKFTLPDPGSEDYNIFIAAFANFDLVIDVREDLDDPETSRLSARDPDPEGSGFHTPVILKVLSRQAGAPQTYYVLVDGFGEKSEGNFYLDFYYAPHPSFNNNDICATATRLKKSNEIQLEGYNSNFSSTCSPINGPDAIWVYIQKKKGQVTFSSCDSEPFSRSLLSLRHTCHGDEWLCSSGLEEVSTYCGKITTELDPGLYYLGLKDIKESVKQYKFIVTYSN